MRFSARLRRLAGHSLYEVTVSSAFLVGLFAFGIPVYQAIGDAGDEGGARLSVSTSNQDALMKIAEELQNSSTTSTDALGNARLRVTVGDAPRPLRHAVTGGMGGFRGVLGTAEGECAGSDSGVGGGMMDLGGGGGGGGGLLGALVGEIFGDADNMTHAMKGSGSGHYDGSRWGRERSEGEEDRGMISAPSLRPRHAQIGLNNVLTFQKVSDYVVQDGAPVIVWSSPITYRVEDHRLVRVQDGETRVVAQNAVGLRVDVTDAGTVMVTLVSQKQTNATGTIQFQANQIEVGPKN